MQDDTLDGVLERFAATGPEFGRGLANHGPMACEALVALGRVDDVEPWAEFYAPQLQGRPSAARAIHPGDWREALGDVRRVGDWVLFFEREVAARPWQDVLEEWTSLLAPGVMAGATHGVIRTAHAVRALDTFETPVRRHEFAEGLAYWAARYQQLPGSLGPPRGMRVSEALHQVRRIDDSERGRFLIFDAVRVLDEERFGDAIDLAAPDKSPDFISELTSAFSRQFIANAGTAAIGFVHTVTAPAALRLLAPHLSAATAELAMRYVWQACAAIYATYGRVAPSLVRQDFEEPHFDRDDLITRAVATHDEHVIKFTEACLREHAHSRDPALIAAAQVLAGRAEPRKRPPGGRSEARP